MVTLLDFLTELVLSAVRLFVVVLTEVIFRQPIDVLALINGLIGGLLIAGSAAFLGYLALGAVLDLVGLPMWTPDRGPSRRA